ncbi:hypothetical protein D3C81_1858560 [compost metagenome]
MGVFGDGTALTVGSFRDVDGAQGQGFSCLDLIGLLRRLQRRGSDSDTDCKHVYGEGQRPECQGRARGNGVLCTQEGWGGHADSHRSSC